MQYNDSKTWEGREASKGRRAGRADGVPPGGDPAMPTNQEHIIAWARG